MASSPGASMTVDIPMPRTGSISSRGRIASSNDRTPRLLRFARGTSTSTLACTRGSRDKCDAVAQALARDGDSDPARLARLCPDDDETQPVERLALRRLEGFEARGIAIVRRHDFSWPLDLQSNQHIRARRCASVLVHDAYRHEREVSAIGLDHGTIGPRLHTCRLAGGVHDIRRPLPAVFVSDDPQRARFVCDRVPPKSVLVPAFGLPPERFAVEEQL